ncbi:MAG: hypothetical protein DLM73_01090 [Chthoniobacterales bacterium]|nr:MAG: hypothetical protein DLM73_01090 [Chthoniobacterales bacterium]
MAIERHRCTQDAVPTDPEVRIELDQLASRFHRILQTRDFVEHFRIVFANVRVARVEFHPTQVMPLGFGVMESRTRDITQGMFGCGGVGFERGGTIRRVRLPLQQLRFKGRSHVRRVPETHLIGQRKRRPTRRKLRRLCHGRLQMHDGGWQVAALAHQCAALKVFVVGFGIDRGAHSNRHRDA